jgi:hypothetical protein
VSLLVSVLLDTQRPALAVSQFNTNCVYCVSSALGIPYQALNDQMPLSSSRPTQLLFTVGGFFFWGGGGAEKRKEDMKQSPY